MTSINAIKFDNDSGAMICDEQRHWNPERLKIYAADKIRSIIPGNVIEKYGIAAAYGNTGTSSIGDELRMTIYREIENIYAERCREKDGPPENFMSLEEVAMTAWRVMCRMKHRHIDEHLLQKFGFTTAEFVQGYYEKNEEKIDIKNDEVVRDALDVIAKVPHFKGPDAIFGNSGIIAGFDRKEGFQIYKFSMREALFEPVESGYLALGSGGDTTNFVLPRFFNRTGVECRNCGVDKTEAIHAMLDAVDMASEHNLGVGGYFNIILFDRKKRLPEGSFMEINDHRSKLSVEAVKAARAGYIDDKICCKILEGLIFEGENTDWGEKELWKDAKDKHGLHRLLRGYPTVCRG